MLAIAKTYGPPFGNPTSDLLIIGTRLLLIRAADLARVRLPALSLPARGLLDRSEDASWWVPGYLYLLF